MSNLVDLAKVANGAGIRVASKEKCTTDVCRRISFLGVKIVIVSSGRFHFFLTPQRFTTLTGIIVQIIEIITSLSNDGV